MLKKPPKPKICKACKGKFTPSKPLQSVCDWECAKLIAEKKRINSSKVARTEQNRELKAAKEKIKSRKEWMDDAQKAFNAFIRARDGNVCISCGTRNQGIQYAAGHYRSRGAAMHLAFNEDNVHTQCNYRCNSVLGGNIKDYRPALIGKIGLDRVEALENNNESHSWTIEELKSIKAEYKAKLKTLQVANPID